MPGTPSNDYYTRSTDFVRLTRAKGPAVEAEFDAVQVGFDNVNTEVDNKVAGPSGDETGWALPAPVANRAITFNATADALETADNDLDAIVTAAQAAQTAAETAQTAAETAQTGAETAETNAETAETNASGYATTAQEWATKTVSIVDATDWSAKAYAINNLTGADGGSSKDWAQHTGSVVTGSLYSAKAYAQSGLTGTAGGSAKDWAQHTGSVVTGSLYSAKAYAQSDLTGAAGGSAKDWAQTAEDTEVITGEYSAKHYAAKAAASAASAGLNANGIQLTANTNLNAGSHRRALIDLQNFTLTIVANATTAYDTGQQGAVWSSHASGGTITAATGVTLNGVDGGSAVLAQGESYGFYRSAADTWWLFNALVS